MRLKVYRYIPILIVIFCASAHAQKITVISNSTLEPIENVAIFNQDMDIATLTDTKGEAEIGSFEENDSIYFQHPSYLRYAVLKSQIEKTIQLKKRIILIDEFVISATKSKENKRDIPFSVDVLSPKKLKYISIQTAADLLLNTGNVSVQKSQGGGGSPIIRGFEANKILLVVDGVRMNNAIYRSGHLQNSITVDNEMLERVEITYGPNSLIYGSDALGGVVHYYTRSPQLGNDTSANFKLNANSTYSSANNGIVNHVDLNVGLDKWAFLAGFTAKSFGDIKTGKNRAPYLDSIYGFTYIYSDQVNGRDTLLTNDNKYLQKYTGYKQYDFTSKIKYKHNNYIQFTGNIQYSTSSNIPRYDQLSGLKYAQWDYGPQNRFLLAGRTDFTKSNIFYDKHSIVAAFQNIHEDRLTRRFGDSLQFNQLEDVSVFTINADQFKRFNKILQVNYGFEYRYNYVSSMGFSQNIYTDKIDETTSRYPDKGSITHDAGVYASFRSDFSDIIILSAGIRFNYSYLHSRFDINTSEFGLDFDRIYFDNTSFTYNSGVVFLPSRDTKFNVLFSKGFRNPNVDDVGKFREKSGQLLIPSEEVKPERSYNIELSGSKTFDGYIQLNATVFATYLKDVIVRQETLLNGNKFVVYQNDTVSLFYNTNANEGIIKGFSASIISDFNTNLSFKSSINYTHGTDITNDEPLAHIPPFFGQTSIMYDIKKFHFTTFINYNGWKELDEMSPNGEDNEDQGTGFGFPGWFTLNFFSVFNVNEQVSLKFSIENVLDTFYRPYASGVSAPGRNFIVGFNVAI